MTESTTPCMFALTLACGLAACNAGNGASAPADGAGGTEGAASTAHASATDHAPDGGAPAGERAADRAAGVAEDEAGKLVLRVREGGERPDRFCIPQWSFENHSGVDVGALLVTVSWEDASSGDVLEGPGEFGVLVEEFTAGKVKDLSLAGFAVGCDALRIRVATYACRDANAVRTACPAALHVVAKGQVSAETSALAEGPMRGAVEG